VINEVTVKMNDDGSIHFKLVETVPADIKGLTDFYLTLQKMYDPDNLTVYDYNTGKLLKYTIKENNDTYGFTIHFDRPYYEGYKFVMEYDNHKRIIDEGKGAYSISMRYAVYGDPVENNYFVLMPADFTYLGHNIALEAPESVEKLENGTKVTFHNMSVAEKDFAWEIKFRAKGIEDEVRVKQTGNLIEIPENIPCLAFLIMPAFISAIFIFDPFRKTKSRR
jgi:hypothetical protein